VLLKRNVLTIRVGDTQGYLSRYPEKLITPYCGVREDVGNNITAALITEHLSLLVNKQGT
jgi:hypothetical protein